MRDGELTEKFETTWLYEEEIMIKTSSNHMKFNFPTLGPLLVEAFRQLWSPLPNVQQLAYANDSVMGFVFEQRFIDYCQRQGRLEVMTSCLGEERPNEL